MITLEELKKFLIEFQIVLPIWNELSWEVGDDIWMEWASSGARGGNCWGKDAVSFSNEYPDFFLLEQILGVIALHAVADNYFSVDTNCKFVNDYYGNHFWYSSALVNISELYCQLHEEGLLVSELPSEDRVVKEENRILKA